MEKQEGLSMNDADIREMWEERAAVREHDGELSRDRAGYLAARDVRDMIAPEPLPEWLIELATSK